MPPLSIIRMDRWTEKEEAFIVINCPNRFNLENMNNGYSEQKKCTLCLEAKWKSVRGLSDRRKIHGAHC